MALFLTGTTENIANYIKTQPIRFQQNLEKTFGQLHAQLLKNSVKITCQNEEQYKHALQQNKIGEFEVSVTLPFSVIKWKNEGKNENIITTTKNETRKKQLTRIIIHGVAKELTENEILQETRATEIKRLKKKTK
jgi:hypothetical protein